MKSLRYGLMATTIAIYLLVVMGNVVRVSDAALACPDWPTCFGQFAFPAAVEARIQVVHRGLAVLAALMVMAAAWAARRRETVQIIRVPLMAAVPLMLVQALLGGVLVGVGAPALLAAIHLGLALIVLALLTLATTAAYGLWTPVVDHAARWNDRLTFRAPFARLAVASTAAVFLVLVSGAVVTASGSGQVCSGWPLCAGGWPVETQGWLQLAHRALTGTATLLVTLVFIRAWQTQRSQRVILTAATAVFVLFAGQVLIGAAKVTRSFPADLVGLHAVSAAALWAVLAVLVTAVGLAGRTVADETAEAASIPGAGQRARDFLRLNKPIIVLLLLVTTYAGMVVGAKQLPSGTLALWTMLGGALAAGGASALNQYIDRELDKNMQRTASRPLPAGRMTAAEGLAYGVGACLAAFTLLAVFVNLLTALLSLVGMIYYVLLYSIWLKKLTVQNIVIGGGAGAIPPLVGWAAATGSLNVPALFLFAIVFLWTPPHFWALALVRRADYAHAGVPMLPVVRGEQETRRQILIYTIELVALTLLMPVFQITGSLFLGAALLLGAWLLSTAWRVFKQGGNKAAWLMYRYSSMYLAFLFLALVLDVLI